MPPAWRLMRYLFIQPVPAPFVLASEVLWLPLLVSSVCVVELPVTIIVT
jgi:hypothetical protein